MSDRADARFAAASRVRDFIHETPLSLCGRGADTCPDWNLAYDIVDMVNGQTPSVAIESWKRIERAKART